MFSRFWTSALPLPLCFNAVFADFAPRTLKSSRLYPVEGDAGKIIASATFSHDVGKLLCEEKWGTSPNFAYAVTAQFFCGCAVAECDSSRVCVGNISSARNGSADYNFTLTVGVSDMVSGSDPYSLFAADNVSLTYVDMASNAPQAVFLNSGAADLLRQVCAREQKQHLIFIAFHRIYVNIHVYRTVEVLFIIGLFSTLFFIIWLIWRILTCCCRRKSLTRTG